MQLIKSIKSFLGIDTPEVKAFQSVTTVQLYNQIYPSWTSYKEIAAYKVLDDIYSVVKKLANTSAAIPMYAYDEDLEYLSNSDPLTKFLRTLTMAKKYEMFTWIYLRGECFIYKKKTLGVNGKVESIHFVNPTHITIALSDEWPEYIRGYRCQDPQRGLDFFIEADEMIFIKYFNPHEDYKTGWRGLSPVSILKQRLTRMESNMKNSVSQMQNGGIPGVMYFKDIPNTPAGKVAIDAAKDHIGRYFKNSDNKGAPLIQAGDMGYFDIGSTLVDLASVEIEKIDFKKICNAWSISDRLFNNDATGSEISDDNAQEGLYLNGCMPTMTMIEDAFNNELVSDFGLGKGQVKWDFSGVWVLQKIMLEKVKVYSEAAVMTPNAVLEAMGEARSDNPLMDLPLIKSGYEPIDNFEPLPPVE